jgi:hypothetical protein
MTTLVEIQAELDDAITHWRRMHVGIEQSDLRYLDRGRYEDYLGAIRVLATVLTRYTTVAALLASWKEQALRSAVARARILAPGRGVLNAEVLEGAAYWHAFRELVLQHVQQAR